jgi:pentatricopeptide repeat protein
LLAIHPDYLLRNTLLQRMEEEGVELTDEGRTSVALGLLRDGQNEMALDYWTDMVNQGVEIPSWVAETFIFVFTIRGFLDEALDVLAQALEFKLIDRTPRFRPVWTYLLDECSRNFHYAGTKRIWDEMVQTKELVPSDGVVINVLNTAARHADPALATSAIELLSARNVKLGPHHYEPLLESYVHAGNLTDAFRVLGIMRDAGLKPDRASTRSIYLELVKPGPGKVDRVPGAVARLKESGPNPPAAAVNAILEAAAKTRDIARTLDVYRAICERCQGVAPNQQTFALLLDECGGSVHAAFVVQEMDRYSVRPTHGILDHLIRCFAVDGNLDVALKYLDELGRLAGDQPTGRWISQRTLTAVLRRCFKERHERMWTVLEEAKKRGMQVEEWTGEKKE